MRHWKLFVCTLAVLATGMMSFAFGALCSQCGEGVFTADIGTCEACGDGTASGMFHLCNACGDKKDQCQACLKPIKKNSPEVPAPKVAIAQEWKELYGADEAQRKRIVVKNQKDWEAVWSAMVGGQLPKPQTPKVDFNTHIIIAVFMGRCRNGGYNVTITNIEDIDGKRVVTVKEQSPNPADYTTQAVTSPHHVVLVPRTDLPVVFADEK